LKAEWLRVLFFPVANLNYQTDRLAADSLHETLPRANQEKNSARGTYRREINEGQQSFELGSDGDSDGSGIRAPPALSQGATRRRGVRNDLKAPAGWQMIIFATLTLSIIASRFIDYYRAAIPWSPFRDWQYLLFALIVSLLEFPIVYRKAQSSRNEPLLVQLGVIFAAGLRWEKMLSTTADLLKPIVLNSH